MQRFASKCDEPPSPGASTTTSCRFFFDENLLGVGRAIALARDDVVYPGHTALPQIPQGAADALWLPIIGSAGLNLVLITRDLNIRNKPGERALLRQHSVRGLFLTGKQDMNRWDKLSLLVKNWDQFERRLSKNGPGPWALSLTPSGFRDIPL